MNSPNSLEDFKNCIGTTSKLLEFCLQSTQNPKAFEFVSSIENRKAPHTGKDSSLKARKTKTPDNATKPKDPNLNMQQIAQSGDLT
ncbi:hypothetical protein CONCODRAFT_7338 [Conidiobolus coronatus NRRL 28638]|uniref:Uncharacterized protein n=1 Tax=Conidiobolus coronatus (strain ATCC 28846 / CBS 209.66 / NRRL 28638) TaxID=796925 RepID=A0A137P506_CONC2|nr:hypothetical protein CONCODRAFT_7338 [Conidiobolus coronatus NRRL 28638]|eukprot:KXN70102.1 hypothetical protein CONCODRAFT_7338 [Conidiobolus coronatus NRRL 28638]